VGVCTGHQNVLFCVHGGTVQLVCAHNKKQGQAVGKDYDVLSLSTTAVFMDCMVMQASIFTRTARFPEEGSTKMNARARSLRCIP
jgi:anthranilate/para-aminobenzoate synthase component II